jgi:hypothetical protein
MRALAAIVILGACSAPVSSAPATEWTRAWAVADCAPWDGSATSIIMTDAPDDSPPPFPQLRISVYHDLQSVAGARWPVGASAPDGGAGVYCPAGGACVSATGGWVDFEPAADGGTLRGRYELTMPDGRRWNGSFVAPVRQMKVMCG